MTGMRNDALGTYGFNPFSAGRKQYGRGETFAPTMGQVDKTGYKDRSMRNNARGRAYQAYLKDKMKGKNASANVLRFQR